MGKGVILIHINTVTIRMTMIIAINTMINITLIIITIIMIILKSIIAATFYPFGQFCEIDSSLRSLQKHTKATPNLFQRGVEYGKYADYIQAVGSVPS